MKSVSVFALVLTIIVCCTSQINGQGKPDVKQTKLAVYYETLCPDSKRFLKTQLKPLLRSPIGKYLDVELVPYGKATTTTSENGDYKFSCQHGDDECQGNKLHACALKHLSKMDAEKVITCSMSYHYPPGQVESCTKDLGLGYEPIANCAKSIEGMELLAQKGRSTHALSPRMYFVPWIVFDGVWSEETMERSLQDLKAVVCEKIGKETCQAAENNHENRGSRRVRSV